MRVLVTGGAGFIGRHVVRAIAESGQQVRVLDALLPGVHSGQSPEFPPDVEFILGDVADPSVIEAALHGIDVVCHQAAMVGRGKEISEAPAYVRNNELATATLLAAMTQAGLTRLVHASSVVIYGDSRYHCPAHGQVRCSRRSKEDLDAGRFEPKCPHCPARVTAKAVTEDDVPDPPRNTYAVTKLGQEHLVEAWAREVGATAIALRYHNVYGPDMPFDSPYSGVAAVFRSAVERGEAPRVFEDGGPMRDFVHVRDVAAANRAALDWTGTGFRAFNIASGTPRTISEMASTLAAATGAPAPIITGEYRIGDVRHIFASPERAIRELNWRPAVRFDDGIKEVANTPMRRVTAK
jgi:dTDP-L-rhamnose 4-epimerase